MTRARPYDRDTALEAAQTLFWEKGYHATSLKDLEHALQMKPGSIYAAFKSKENLYLLALEKYFDQSRGELRAELDACASPLDALSGLLRGFTNAGRTAPEPRSCMLVKTLLETTEDDGTIAACTRGFLDDVRADFAAAFRSAQDAGEIPQDADIDHLALKYQSALSALKIEAHRGTDPAAIGALAEDFALWVEGLRIDRG